MGACGTMPTDDLKQPNANKTGRNRDEPQGVRNVVRRLERGVRQTKSTHFSLDSNKWRAIVS